MQSERSSPDDKFWPDIVLMCGGMFVGKIAVNELSDPGKVAEVLAEAKSAIAAQEFWKNAGENIKNFLS